METVLIIAFIIFLFVSEYLNRRKSRETAKLNELNSVALKEHANQFNTAVSALIELTAMEAINQERIQNGLSQAYTENDFMDIREGYELTHTDLVNKENRFNPKKS